MLTMSFTLFSWLFEAQKCNSFAFLNLAFTAEVETGFRMNEATWNLSLLVHRNVFFTRAQENKHFYMVNSCGVIVWCHRIINNQK